MQVLTTSRITAIANIYVYCTCSGSECDEPFALGSSLAYITPHVSGLELGHSVFSKEEVGPD